MKCQNCGWVTDDDGQKFCGHCGAPLYATSDVSGKMRKRILDEAWEAGKEQGRKEEQNRATAETKTFLWASVVLGAIAGGIIGSQLSGPPERQGMRIAVGVILGSVLGGMHFFFGCLLTIVIFLVAAVGIVAVVIK